MRGLIAEFRLAVRGLRQTPGFTVIAVLMLAFGIGATTAIFSIVDGVLLRPLPYAHADRLVSLGDQVSGTNWGQGNTGPVTGPDVIAYQRDTHAFESLGGFGFNSYELSGAGEPARIAGSRMTPSVFTVLGVAPLMGRVFTAQEDEQKEQVAVLSYASWKNRFHGDGHILGTKILLDRKPYIVIGVMPRGFEFPLSPGRLFRSEVWVPMSFTADELAPEADASWFLGMVGRLKPGVTPAQAEEDANRVAEEIMRNYPPDEANFRIHAAVYPLQQITVLQARPLLRMLFLAVVVVLLIACANLAGLLLVRAIRRQRETAVRLALGAPARAVLRQMMVESVAITAAGGLIGVGLAALAIEMGRNLLPETLPRLDSVSLNWAVVGFALVLALLTGIFCGLAPGLAALRTNVNDSLKEGGRSGTESGGQASLRTMLVVMEVAVALVLLSASGLLLRSYLRMTEVDLGFQPDHVVTAIYSLPQKIYSTQARVDEFNRNVLERLRQLPGMEAAGMSSTIPTAGAGLEAFVAEGYVDPRGPDRTIASPVQVIGDYFRAMRIPLLRGRYFTDADDANGELAVVVNQEFARRYWPGQNPIGKHMRVGTLKSITPWMTVVGEIADAKLGTPDSDAREQFYRPVAQVEKEEGSYASPTDLNGNDGYLVLRSVLPPKQMEHALRAVVHSIDPQLPLVLVRTMDQVVGESEAPRRFNTIVISSFALAAVVLAVLGVYSIIAFAVASRAQEMAIRMALGSQRSHIVGLVALSGLKIAGVGCVLGVCGAALASIILRSFLFQVNPLDPMVMIAATLAAFVLAMAASALPARRAASIDPIRVLRGE